jgi:hypothetical protein
VFEELGTHPSSTLQHILNSVQERLKKEKVDLGMKDEQVAEVVT